MNRNDAVAATVSALFARFDVTLANIANPAVKTVTSNSQHPPANHWYPVIPPIVRAYIANGRIRMIDRAIVHHRDNDWHQRRVDGAIPVRRSRSLSSRETSQQTAFDAWRTPPVNIKNTAINSKFSSNAAPGTGNARNKRFRTK